MSFFSLLTEVTPPATTAPPPDIFSYIPLVVDIIVVVFLVISAILECRDGFLKGLVGFIGIIISAVIAFNFAETFAEFLESQFHLSTSLSGVVEGILSGMEAFKAAYSEESLLAAMESLALPDFVTQPIINATKGVVVSEGTTIAQVVAPILGGITFTVISGVALFLISQIVIAILGKLLSFIFDKIPVLGGLNKVLGFILGIFKALVTIYALLLVLSLIPLPIIQDTISNTVVVNWLSQNNVIMIILNQFNFQIPGFVGGGTATAAINAIIGV